MLDQNFTKTYTIDGHEIEVEIAPCSWIYNSPFQLRATLKATHQWGSVFSTELGKRLSFEEATEADIDRMVTELVYIAEPCACGNPRMLVKGDTSNRGEKCEACFLKALNDQYEKDVEKQRKKTAKQDLNMAIEGYTHKMIAWIHPKRGGDDYMVDVYFRGTPTEADIQRHLKSSHEKNDYRIEELPQPTKEQKEAHQAAVLKKAGLPADTIGRKIAIKDKVFTVAGVDPKKPKTSVHLKDQTGADFTCTIAVLKKYLA